VIAGRIDGNWRLSLPLTAAVAVIATLTFGIRGTAKLTTVPPQFTDVVAEDAYGVFSIAKTRNGYLSVRNNATELVYLYGHPETQFVQESQAHFPLLLAPRRDRVLVVGSGYGITAGAAASWPDVRHVDAVEILPLMVANAPFFEPGNHGYHHNPKVSVYVADGRHFLAAARQPYDVISINVSDPYLPGSSSLFSTEFYGWVTRALSQEGIVCQHLFGPDIASLYHGFKRHFSHVKVIRSYGNGVSVLGSQSPLQVRSIEALKNSALSAVLRAVQLDSLRAFEGRLAEGERLQKALEAAMPEFENSDLRPVLEFRRSPNVPLLYSNF
jgi:spermidine synthase